MRATSSTKKVEDLSTKPRCIPCRESKKGCDRRRPCQRCEDAGFGDDQCTSEDEGSGRKGRFARQKVAAAKPDAQDYAQIGRATPLALEEGKNQGAAHGNTRPSLSLES